MKLHSLKLHISISRTREPGFGGRRKVFIKKEGRVCKKEGFMTLSEPDIL